MAGCYGKTLADFTTFGNIYQPCAALAPGAALTETSIFNYIGLVGMTARATARCDSPPPGPGHWCRHRRPCKTP